MWRVTQPHQFPRHMGRMDYVGGQLLHRFPDFDDNHTLSEPNVSDPT